MKGEHNPCAGCADATPLCCRCCGTPYCGAECQTAHHVDMRGRGGGGFGGRGGGIRLGGGGLRTWGGRGWGGRSRGWGWGGRWGGWGGRWGGWRGFGRFFGWYLAPWLVYGAGYAGWVPYGWAWGNYGYYNPAFPGIYLEPYQLQYTLAQMQAAGYDPQASRVSDVSDEELAAMRSAVRESQKLSRQEFDAQRQKLADAPPPQPSE